MSQIGKFLNLHPHMQSWAVYNVNGPYTSANKIGTLSPAQFGGLSYTILEEKGGDVYIIQTESYGRCAIWAPRDNDSSITTSPAYSNGNTSGGGSTGGGSNDSDNDFGGIIPGGLKVFIDPGHGGSDPGAIGNSLQEKDIVLSISKQVGTILNSRGVSVQYSRTSDKYVSLEGRPEQANNWGANLFVSIHTNSASALASGTECYTTPTADARTKQLSANIARAISNKFGLSNRGHKEEVWRVLRLSNMPAILIETAFINHPNDANLLRNRQHEFATVIADEICKYLNVSISDSPIDLISQLTNVAIAYDKSYSRYNLLVLDYLRHVRYATDSWVKLIGKPGSFINHVKQNYSTLHNKLLPYISSKSFNLYNNEIDLAHLSATLMGYKNIGLPTSIVAPNHWFGWGGDLATGIADITELKLTTLKDKSEEFIAENYVIGHTYSSISIEDINADIDAYAFVTPLFTDRFDVLLKNYFKTVTSKSRRDLFLSNNNLNSSSSLTDINNKINILMTGTSGFNYPIVGQSTFYKLAITDSGIEPTSTTINAACKAFAKYINSL